MAHMPTSITPIGFYKNGRPIFPIMGGSEPSTDVAPAPESTSQPDGFPANTPLEQMNADQRESYWKHQARKHEERVKAYGGVTPDQLATLRQKAERQEALEQELMSDKDKAIAQAAKDAESKASDTYMPQLVAAKLDAAAARKGVSEDSLTAALSFVDHAKFLNDSGQIDPAKVSAFIDGIAPAKGNQPKPKGPVLFGGGARPNTSVQPGEQGRLMAEKRFGKQ